MPKCSVCLKTQATTEFSKTQLSKGKNAQCIYCTPGNRLEIFCNECRRVKPHTAFSKSARRNNQDEKRCIPCQARVTAKQPDDAYRSDDGEGESSGSDSEMFGSAGYSNLGDNQVHGLPSTAPNTQQYKGFVEQSRSGKVSVASQGKNPSQSRGMPQASYPRPSAPSIASGSSRTSQASTIRTGKSSAWAKPPKGPSTEYEFPSDDEDDDYEKDKGEASSDEDSDDSDTAF